LSGDSGFRKSVALDVVTGLVFALFGYVALIGGIGVPSSQFRSVTGAAILLSIVLLTRVKFRYSILPPFLRRAYDGISEHPFLLGLLLFLPLALSMILRPLFMQTMLEDAGAVNQSIFQFFGTPPLHCDACFQGSFLGDHQAYTLFFPWVWVQVFRSPYAISYFAVLCAVLTFGVIVWNFRARLSRKTLSFLILAVFAIRGFRAGYYFDFREDSLAALFFALTLVFGFRKHWVGASLTLFLAAMSKETGAILAPMLLPWFFLQTRGMEKIRRAGWFILFTGVAFLGVYLSLLKGIPAWANSTGESNMLIGRLSYLGATPTAIFENFIRHPFQVLNPPGGGTSNHLRYLFHLILPFFPFMVLAWDWAYFPGIVLAFGNLISLSPAQRSMNFHYDLLILPFFAFGLARSLGSKKRIFSGRSLALWILPFLIVSGVWPIVGLTDLWRRRSLSAERVFIRAVAARIPREGVILADVWTYPHLVDHPELRLLPGGDRGRRPIDDATFAIAEGSLPRRDEASRRFFADFDRKACSPSGRFCFWERRK
jgi:hypothetical protein